MMPTHVKYECLCGNVIIAPIATMVLSREIVENEVYYKRCIPKHVKESGLFKSEACEKAPEQVAVTYYQYSINRQGVPREEFDRVSDLLRGAV